MTPTQMAEQLLQDFAKRASQDEDRAYRRYREFSNAAENLSELRWIWEYD
jgi:hypothetical protein